MYEEVQLLTWREASSLIEEVNLPLARLIHELNPNDQYPLIKVNYAFGDLIVKEGVLQIPNESRKLEAISHPTINKKIQSALDYSPIPLSLILHKNSEVFLSENERTIPLNILKPGSLFGLFEVIDFLFNRKSFPSWNVSAGLRSIFMLPKVSEFFGIKRLRNHYHLPFDVELKTLNQHWQVFKQIARAPLFSPPWKNAVLFFTKPWLAQKNQPSWMKFYHFLFEQGWAQVQYAINEVKLNPFWQECIQAIAYRRLKPTPYLIDTVKHLFTIAMGLAPGLAVTYSEADLPRKELEEAFTKIYLLEHYFPTIFGPALLNESSGIIYYSLAFPTLPSGLPHYKTHSSFMSDIKIIKLIIEGLIKQYSMNAIFQNTCFDYFHTEKDQDNEIQLSTAIPIADQSFLEKEPNFPGKHFCATSPFWRGAIRLKHNTKA